MKTKGILKSLTLAFIVLFSGSVLMAQSKEKDEKAAQEAEMKAKKEMLEQQKQMQEQQKKMQEMEIIYADRARDYERQARESARASSRSRTYVSSSGESGDYFIYSGDQHSSSHLTLRNSFDGKSHSSKGEFEVKEDTRNFKVMISGKVKSGEIRIIVDYPGGDTFKDMTINSAAEITFSQSVSISEEEPDKYIGEWTYKISAENAEGSYQLSIMTH